MDLSKYTEGMKILLSMAPQKSKFTHQSSGDLMVDGSGNLMKNYLKIIDEPETGVPVYWPIPPAT